MLATVAFTLDTKFASIMVCPDNVQTTGLLAPTCKCPNVERTAPYSP